MGITRTVVLIGPLALKFPSHRHRFRYFRQGMTANRLERLTWLRFTFWQFSASERMCPSLWCSPMGLVLVQRRVKPLDRVPLPEELCHIWRWSTDHKRENYGVLDGRVVCVDYA